ncbi:Uncharacterised protein [Bordetella pertussis]|nr:Uncharacterised protein [Bordetella pertussis]
MGSGCVRKPAPARPRRPSHRYAAAPARNPRWAAAPVPPRRRPPAKARARRARTLDAFRAGYGAIAGCGTWPRAGCRHSAIRAAARRASRPRPARPRRRRCARTCRRYRAFRPAISGRRAKCVRNWACSPPRRSTRPAVSPSRQFACPAPAAPCRRPRPRPTRWTSRPAYRPCCADCAWGRGGRWRTRWWRSCPAPTRPRRGTARPRRRRRAADAIGRCRTHRRWADRLCRTYPSRPAAGRAARRVSDHGRVRARRPARRPDAARSRPGPPARAARCEPDRPAPIARPSGRADSAGARPRTR